MLEAIAIAALVMGGVTGAVAVTDSQAVAEEDAKVVAVQVQSTAPAAEAAKPANPFLD